MGLDTVELVMRIEETFGISIPDSVASQLRTPKDVTDFILTQVEVSDKPLFCLSQRAFHLLRHNFMQTLAIPRRSVRVDTFLEDIIPKENGGGLWEQIGRNLCVKTWPGISEPKWWRFMLRPNPQTVRELVAYLLTHEPLIVKGEERAWSRAQITEVLRLVIEDETGVRDFTQYSRFVDDMGLD